MLRISGGEVYDPANGIDGEVRDIYLDGGMVVAPPPYPQAAQTIDATGMVVMPGGVDLHAHIAGAKVNVGRKMRPEDHRRDAVPKTAVTRSGSGGSVPSTFVAGYRYSALGYTTVVEAAVPPLGARHAHEELNDTPLVDSLCLTLMGNNYFVLRAIERGEFEQLCDFVGWLLQATGGFGIKIVNPGGGENWKWGLNIEHVDQATAHFAASPRQILTSLARAREALGLPHPIHVHANRLGLPGNYTTTLDSLRLMETAPIHLTHLQFSAYDGQGWGDFRSGAPQVVEYINAHDNVTFDMGQVIFGDTTTMTADGPWQHRLHRLTGHKWVNADVENEAASGVVPYTFKPQNPVNAVQWAIGLEAALLMQDPWRVCLTTDHPNAGPFYHYPKIIRWLMDRDARQAQLEAVHRRARTRTTLESIAREYSLYEIAILTRAGPARLLGLKHKGHLGVGADADVAIYRKQADYEAMFARAAYTIKGGQIVVRDGVVVQDLPGRRLYVAAPFDREIEAAIREDFERLYTVEFENYPVQYDHYLSLRAAVAGGQAPDARPRASQERASADG